MLAMLLIAGKNRLISFLKIDAILDGCGIGLLVLPMHTHMFHSKTSLINNSHVKVKETAGEKRYFCIPSA